MQKHYECDVLVIGGGGAGTAAAVAAVKEGARVLLVTKDPAGYGNTRISGGLIAHPGLSGEDDAEKFFRDLIVGGEFLNNQDMAYVMAGEGRRASCLLEREGMAFDRDVSGSLSSEAGLRLGGHSCIRSLVNSSAGIGYGHILKGALARAGVQCVPNALVTKLLTANTDGGVVGAAGIVISDGEFFTVAAKETILATGGGGWLYYPHTDVNRMSTGDGYALAYEAGADLIDMEQVQFVPFALTHPKSMVGILCGEPFTVGPKGKVMNQSGDEFITGANVMTRAQVAKAIVLEVERGGGTKYGGVILDLRENKQDPLGQRIKKIYETASKAIGDAVRFAYGTKAEAWDEPWDVYPSAHYFMGGVRIDVDGRCSRPKNLYAVGEVSGGLHGGNRLGSTALAELFLFGLRAGEHAGRSQKGRPVPAVQRKQVHAEKERIEGLREGRNGRYRPVCLVRQLQGTMWNCAGPVRELARLGRGQRVLDEIEGKAQEMKLCSLKRWNGELVDALELSLMLPVARMIIRSADARKESRGAHFRLDFPYGDADRNVGNIIVRNSSRGKMEILTEPVSFSRLKPRNGGS